MNHPFAAQVYTNATTLAHFKRFAQLFACLAPYRRRLAGEAAALGYPLARALLLHYPDDARARAVDDAFLLGDELLAAPCFSERADATRDVYIPAGHAWVHLFTGQRHDCTARPCDLRAESAPFGAPLVFAREGGAHFPLLAACAAPHREAPVGGFFGTA